MKKGGKETEFKIVKETTTKNIKLNKLGNKCICAHINNKTDGTCHQ